MGQLCALMVLWTTRGELAAKAGAGAIGAGELENPFTFKLPGLGRVIPKEGSSELEPLNQ